MATYTGVADANGDFTVPFSSNYTSGQRITVTAEKDAATKTIELFAPASPVVDDAVIAFGGTLFNFPANITSVTLSKMTGAIADNAFKVNAPTDVTFQTKATSLVINSLIAGIGNNAFQNWPKIISLTLPDSLLTIGDNAFSTCVNLKTLIIPNSVKNIGALAFSDCTNLTHIVIGSGVQAISEYAFNGLIKAVSITCLATVPPPIDTSVFNGIKSTAKFYVPAGSVAAYKAEYGWGIYSSKIFAIV